jgi:hypothetical protein
MTVVTLDASAALLLRQTRDKVTLCDQAGNILGIFLPTESVEKTPPLVSPYTKEDLDRTAASETWKPLNEIMERLHRDYPIQ